MRHVWVLDAGNVLLVGVLSLKMYALWGAPLTRANGYINFSTCMRAWGGLRLNPLDLFFLGNLLKPMGKPMGKPGNTWGHRKYSALKTPLAYAFAFFGNKHMQTYANTIKHASLPLRRHDTIFMGPRWASSGFVRVRRFLACIILHPFGKCFTKFHPTDMFHQVGTDVFTSSQSLLVVRHAASHIAKIV